MLFQFIFRILKAHNILNAIVPLYEFTLLTYLLKYICMQLYSALYNRVLPLENEPNIMYYWELFLMKKFYNLPYYLDVDRFVFLILN